MRGLTTEFKLIRQKRTKLRWSHFLGRAGLLALEESFVDVRKDTSLADLCHGEKFIELFVTSDGEGQHSWCETSSLSSLGKLVLDVDREVEDLLRKVLENTCHVNSSGIRVSICVATLSEGPVAASWSEPEASFGRA